MGKKSRKSGAAKGDATDTSGSSRSAARRQQQDATKNRRRGSFLERYRNLLVGAVAVVGVGLLGYMVFSSATASAYTCDSLLEAPDSQMSPPAFGETEERLGFLVDMSGRTHSNLSISYASCPPASGEHRGGGALVREFYDPGSVQKPNDWLHNLEHGYAVIAYTGDPEPEILAQIRGAMDAPAPSEVAVSCGLPNKVIALRFDDMSEPFAVLAWGRALLMSTFDEELATAAAEQFQDQPQAPERAC